MRKINSTNPPNPTTAPLIPEKSPDNPFNIVQKGAPIFDGNEIGIAMLAHVIGALIYFMEKIGTILTLQREIHKV